MFGQRGHFWAAVAVFCTGLGVAACSVFDEALLDKIELSTDLKVQRLSASCQGSEPLPLLPGSDAKSSVYLDQITNDEDEAACDIKLAVREQGDAFFEVQASAGQRWHFHLDPKNDDDLALYIMSDCDVRDCEDSSDVCGHGGSEHFTFMPATAGTYTVAIDGITDLSAPPELLAIKLVCGDGQKQHGENCDDGDLQARDGCDPHCRSELLEQGNQEVEPNDDRYNANVIEPIGDFLSRGVEVAGSVGGESCQDDWFLVRVDSPGANLGASLRRQFPSQSGSERMCDVEGSLGITLYSSSDENGFENPTPNLMDSRDDGTCPALEQRVDIGTYLLRVRGDVSLVAFDYTLEVTVTD